MKTNYLTEAGSGTLRWLLNLFSPPTQPVPSALTETGTALAPRLMLTNGKTILVVDDDPVFLKATAMKFEANGYTVLTAKDGSEAIQAARRQKPNLLVLDVCFPPDVASGGSVPWDGFRIMSWLRRFNDFKETPVVMTSMGDPIECTRLAIHAGATAFFHKQMDPAQLLSIVKGTLARSDMVKAPSLDANFQI